MENEGPDKLTEAPSGTVSAGHEAPENVSVRADQSASDAGEARTRADQPVNHEQGNPATSVKKGDIVEATVKRIAPFGAFVRLADGSKGLVHISQIDDAYVTEIREHLKVGDNIKAKVLAIGEDGRIDLSIKKAKKRLIAKKGKPRPTAKPRSGSGFKITPFEEAFDKKLDVTLES